MRRQRRKGEKGRGFHWNRAPKGDFIDTHPDRRDKVRKTAKIRMKGRKGSGRNQE